jgi:hypothetical protein
VDQEVVGPGDVVHGACLREPPDPLDERPQQGPGVGGEPHHQHGLQPAPDGGRVDLGAVAADHPCVLQPLRTGQARRRRDAHALRERLVRESSVLLQLVQQRTIYRIQDHVLAHRPNF